MSKKGKLLNGNYAKSSTSEHIWSTIIASESYHAMCIVCHSGHLSATNLRFLEGGGGGYLLYSKKFRQEFNFVASSEQFLTKLNSWLICPTNHSVGLKIFMNVKIKDKQKSDDRTNKRATTDFLTKINSWRSLLTKFFADENFLLYSNLKFNCFVKLCWNFAPQEGFLGAIGTKGHAVWFLIGL